MRLKQILIPAALLLFAGCTTQTSLSYGPPPPIPGLFAPAPVVAMLSVTDERKEAPRRLATIMSMTGMPTAILDTRMPVKDEVGTVFDQALLVRRLTMNDGQGPLAIALVVHKFDSDMILGGQANIDLDMAVIDRRTNQVVYGDRVHEQTSDTGHIAQNLLIGAYATDIGVLREMCEQVLNEAVNELLEKPAFKQIVMRAASGNGT